MDYRKRQRQARLREICGMHVYPWLIELGDYAKENGIYPATFADLYPDPRDKEIAAVIDAMVPKSRKGSYLMEFRNMLGMSLHDRVRRRDFLHLTDNAPILGAVSLRSSQLFNLLDWIWSVTVQDRVSLEYAVLGELGIIRRMHRMPMSEAMERKDQRYRLEMVLAKMTLRGGYGCGQWDYLEEDELPCPVDAAMKRLLRAYYPIYPVVPPQEMIDFMGIKKPADMLYVSWGYDWIRKSRPIEVGKLEKKVARWVATYKMWHDIPIPDVLWPQKNAPTADAAGSGHTGKESEL